MMGAQAGALGKGVSGWGSAARVGVAGAAEGGGAVGLGELLVGRWGPVRRRGGR